MPSAPAFKDILASDFGEYLDRRGFKPVPIEPTPGLASVAFTSDSFRLWFYGEHGGDVYAKVAPLESESSAYYLGAVLGFVRNESEPVLGRHELSRGLAQHHEDIKALMAEQAVDARSRLAVWVAGYASRTAEVLRLQAAANRARKKWWQVWL